MSSAAVKSTSCPGDMQHRVTFFLSKISRMRLDVKRQFQKVFHYVNIHAGYDADTDGGADAADVLQPGLPYFNSS